MSSSKCSFTCICGIFLPLNPSTTTVYARSAFYPSLHFTISLQSAFYTQSVFYPWSAVCSSQSAVFPLHWPYFLYRMSTSRIHVTALLFRIEAENRNWLTNPACTSREYVWTVPADKTAVQPEQISEMVWKASKLTGALQRLYEQGCIAYSGCTCRTYGNWTVCERA